MKYKFHVDKKGRGGRDRQQRHLPFADRDQDRHGRKLEILIGEVDGERGALVLRRQQAAPGGVRPRRERLSARDLRRRGILSRPRCSRSTACSITRKSRSAPPSPASSGASSPATSRRSISPPQDRVEENDIVLIHEAMKMENEIRAPKIGRDQDHGRAGRGQHPGQPPAVRDRVVRR